MNTTEIQSKINELKTAMAKVDGLIREPQQREFAHAAYNHLLELETLIAEEIEKMNRARAARDATGSRGGPVPDYDPRQAEIFERGFDATKNVWNAKTQSFAKEPDIPTQLKALELYLKWRHGMPPQMILQLDAARFRDRHNELREVASTPSGRKVLLDAGLITEEWLARHLPEEKQK